MTGIAYDAAYPDLPAILAKHPIYVDCYTDGPFAYGVDKIAQIHAAGAGVKWNHERAVDQMSTAAGGRQAALDGMSAMLAVGTPANNTVALFLDADQGVAVDSAKWSGYLAGFEAANAVLRPAGFLVGFYGEGALIDELMRRGLIQVKGWLSASSSFPGYNPSSPNVGEYQIVGSDVPSTDKDIVTDALHMGVWWPSGGAPLGSGSAITQEDDMSLEDTANIKWLVSSMNDVVAAVTYLKTYVTADNAKLDDHGSALVAIATALGHLSVGTSDPAVAAQLVDIQTKLAALASKTYTGTLS